MQIWLTYVDDVDNGSRENWSVFYVEPIVTTSRKNAELEGKKEVERKVREFVCELWDDDDVDELWDDDDVDEESYKNHFTYHIQGPFTVPT